MRVKHLDLNYLSILKFLFFALIFFVVAMVAYFPNYARLKKLKEANHKLVGQVKTLSTEIKALQKKLKKVGKDQSLYEELARQNLGVARENEIVVDIKE